MNPQLQEKLIRDLRQSGFYSEMMAIHACRTAGWDCHGSFTYFDKDERATRECDFDAVRSWEQFHSDRTAVKVVARLLGQVKKSERPWIVSVDRATSRYTEGSESLLRVSAEATSWEVSAILRDQSLVLENGWAASGMHEAFKKPTDTSRWYSAFVSACKACESAYESAIDTMDPVAVLIRPVVVLDGTLITAELNENAELVLSETDHAGFRFEYRSDQYDRAAYDLDLVTLTGLPSVLERLAIRMNTILAVLNEGGEPTAVEFTYMRNYKFLNEIVADAIRRGMFNRWGEVLLGKKDLAPYFEKRDAAIARA